MPSGRPSKRKRSTLGTRLVALREEAGLSQQAVAAKLDVRQQVVAYLEREAVTLRPTHATTLARLYKITVGELLGEGPAHGSGPLGKLRDLCVEIAALPRDNQEQIVKVLATLVAQAKAS